MPTEDAGYELVTRIRLGDDTYSEEELIDDLNTMYDDSYPFLLTDGVTFYFASNEEDRTLGGYDIFVTKYNINTDEYSDPEQLPMPFNSPYNDYMMAIDEVNHVGWFASDRYQPEGKVCIYIFLYEKTPEFYFPEDRSLRLRQLARLVSIRETWKDGVDYKPVLEKIRNMQPAEKKTPAKNAIAFVVTDRIVYTTLSQFKSKEARDLFVKSQELRRVISANETELDRLRKEYSAGKNLSATAGRIQELEKLLMTLYPQPEDYGETKSGSGIVVFAKEIKTFNIVSMDLFVLLIVALCIVALAVFFYFVPFLLWISALVSGVHISLVQLFLMRIRKVPPQIIVRAMIEAHKAGLKSITRDELEAHYWAGGRVERVVHALVSAAKANIDLGFQMATAIDLAGRDVFEAVQMSVNPKVIDSASGCGGCQRRHSAYCQSPGNGACQHSPIGGRSRRRYRFGSCGRRYRVVYRLVRVA